MSILMLTHNAPKFVKIAVRTVVEQTKDVDIELVVVDNDSATKTRRLVTRLARRGLIQKLELLDYNSLFAEGNNIAASIAEPTATHFLLLNSDIEVRDPAWLSRLLAAHRRGITTYGIVDGPTRVDGYCLLIDADIYREYRLDEGHQWWWAVTKLQAQLLNQGLSVQGYREHEGYLHHFGGKSGDSFSSAQGMNVTREEVDGWFAGRAPVVLDGIE